MIATQSDPVPGPSATGPKNSTPARVRSVLGDVDPVDLGSVNYHEHLFQVTPLLAGDELTDERLSMREAQLLLTSGFTAMVDATPIGLGRNPAALARISQHIGLGVVATTGGHREAHYGSSHWLVQASTTELARMFGRDVIEGMPIRDDPAAQSAALGPSSRPVRAGMLKAGVGFWSITAFERRVLEAVAIVHRRTAAPVMVHLEHGSAAFEVLDILAGHGVEPSAVVLAHMDRNPDAGLHAEIADRGAYLGYDGAARHQYWSDESLIDCLIRAADRGAADRIVLGGDVARSSRYVAYGGMPGLQYLGHRFVPRLQAAGGIPLVTKVLRTNPHRLLARFDLQG
ncbi:MAG: aryldialkylphosphatase [Nakamurella sp.]